MEHLPDLVGARIMYYLPPVDAYKLKYVCKNWYYIVKENSKYYIGVNRFKLYSKSLLRKIEFKVPSYNGIIDFKIKRIDGMLYYYAWNGAVFLFTSVDGKTKIQGRYEIKEFDFFEGDLYSHSDTGIRRKHTVIIPYKQNFSFCLDKYRRKIIKKNYSGIKVYSLEGKLQESLAIDSGEIFVEKEFILINSCYSIILLDIDYKTVLVKIPSDNYRNFRQLSTYRYICNSNRHRMGFISKYIALTFVLEIGKNLDDVYDITVFESNHGERFGKKLENVICRDSTGDMVVAIDLEGDPKYKLKSMLKLPRGYFLFEDYIYYIQKGTILKL